MPATDSPDIESLVPAPIDGSRYNVVLFDIAAEFLPRFAVDARGLSSGPIRLHWLASEEDALAHVLVRVVSPKPLLIDRVLDRSRESTAIAYIEQAPGMWVQLGFRHRGLDAPSPPDAHFLLLRPGSQQIVLATAFAEEAESLALGAVANPCRAGSLPPTIEFGLRLTRHVGADQPRLWVLRDDALSQLAAYCRTTHQQLLTRFTVAVSASAGTPCVVLRAITAKGPPPVFVGPAVGFVPLLKLPNVYLPIDTRLSPVIRRDALRSALRVRDERVYWLHPAGDTRFRVESLAENTFQPLVDWVAFRAPDAVSLGHRWVQSDRWGYEPFVEQVEEARPAPVVLPNVPLREPMPPRPGLPTRALGWLKGRRRPRPSLPIHVDRSVSIKEALQTALNPGDRLHHVRPELVNSAIERAQALEAQFLKALPSRTVENGTELWAELAATYDAAGNHADASLCWLNALWGQQRYSSLWAWGWLRSEAKAARPEVKVIDPGPWLAAAPGPGTTRAMAAWVVWASLQSPIPTALSERVGDMQARLETHEHWLPIRAAWLARTALARAGRGDVLGLARTRDRMVERLMTTGLSLELDTPSFLRFAGDGVRERFQEARRWLADRRDLIHQWLARRPQDTWIHGDPADGSGPLRQVGLEPDVAHTRAYADLILAWGLTRFAEYATAEQVRRHGLAALPAHDAVHAVLRDAFEFRIAQVRNGKPPRGPLPAPLVARIDALGGVPRYAIEKLREHSRLLEPTAGSDGYWETMFRKLRGTSPARTLSNVPADRLDEEVGRALAAETRRDGQPNLLDLTLAVLAYADDLSEAGMTPVFEILPLALNKAWNDPPAQRRLIERGLAAAARWDRADIARDLAGRFLHLTDEIPGWELAEALIGPTVRALHRVGLRAQADRVLDHLAERIHRGQPLGRVRTDRPGDWAAALRVLLHAAAGWYASGRDEAAHAVLDEARKDLFAAEMSAPDRTALAFAYVNTLGQAPVRVALGRLEEMFQRLTGIQVGGTTNAYYSLQPLMLVETAVRAVVSDDFALGPQVRAWLDVDELAVRRRIRDDLKAMLASQGL